MTPEELRKQQQQAGGVATPQTALPGATPAPQTALPDATFGGGSPTSPLPSGGTVGQPQTAPSALQMLGSPAPAPSPNTGGVPGGSGQYGGINPSGAVSQDSGINSFQQWAKTTFGREASPQELQQIAQQIGYQGGPISPDQMTQAQNAAMQIARGLGWQGPGQATPEAPPTTDALLEQRIRALLEQDPTQIDPNSPAMAAQRDSFRRGNQRAVEDAKRAMAQRAASGFAGGATEAGMTGININAAQREGDFEAGLMQRELQTQRDQTMQAMQMAQQAGLTREARQLQERLATQDLALRRMLGMGQLGLGAAQLSQQGNQFNANLGFNYWNALQNAQRNELLSLLGGL